MGFFDPTDTHGVPLNLPYAEDIMQVTHGLTGLLDLGALSLLGPLAAPAGAPAITLQAGSLTGAYKWQVYWVSGVMDGRVSGSSSSAHITGRTLAGPATTTQNPSSQQATVSISGLTPPTGAIGWGVARTLASGTTFLLVPGSEQFLTIAGTLPATFIDNTADGSLVTAVQATNTTGTTIGAPAVTVASAFPQSPANGARALLRAGSSPYDFIEFVYDSTFGHWVSKALPCAFTTASGTGHGSPATWQNEGTGSVAPYGDLVAAGLSMQVRGHGTYAVSSGTLSIGLQLATYAVGSGATATSSDGALGTTTHTSLAMFDTGWVSAPSVTSAAIVVFQMRVNPTVNNSITNGPFTWFYRWIV